jgi:hypothetical protein
MLLILSLYPVQRMYRRARHFFPVPYWLVATRSPYWLSYLGRNRQIKNRCIGFIPMRERKNLSIKSIISVLTVLMWIALSNFWQYFSIIILLTLFHIYSQIMTPYLFNGIKMRAYFIFGITINCMFYNMKVEISRDPQIKLHTSNII